MFNCFAALLEPRNRRIGRATAISAAVRELLLNTTFSACRIRLPRRPAKAAPAAFSFYFTRTTRVTVGFEVSVPSNVTVPLGRNCRFAGGGGAVTPTAIVIVCTLMLLPRLAMVQTITLPPSPGAGAPQLAEAGVTVTELIVSKGSIVMVNTTLFATVFVPF